MRRALLALVLVAIAALAAAGCGSDEAERPRAEAPGEPVAAKPAVPDDPPAIDPYEPPAGEEFPAAKRLAGRVVQNAMTYARDDSAQAVVARVAAQSRGGVGIADAIGPLRRRGHRSWGRVEYAQLSGMTASDAGAMVVARQTTEDEKGRQRSVVRVADVRLVLKGGAWALDRIVTVGGEEVARPDDLPAVSRRVLDHPNIDLPDSARWDIYRGRVGLPLLDALAQAAERHRVRVAVLRSGHPPNVWASDRISAHTRGDAVDIWSVDGKRVIQQREAGSPAYKLAASFLASGARQVGSPWVLAEGAPRSFSDAVHQDHLHAQFGG